MKRVITLVGAVIIFVVILFTGCLFKKNKAPEIPNAPEGPFSGYVNISYNFTATTTDPEGNDVAYQFNWGGGDNDTSSWSNFMASGAVDTMKKLWSTANTYSIKARAKDKKDKISDWSEPHSITISIQVIRWTKTYGGTEEDGCMSVQQTSDGGYIMTGVTESYGAGWYDIWLIKTDTLGTVQWNKTFGESDDDYGYSVRQTTDGGYIVVGTSFYDYDSAKVRLIKTDASGNTQWQKIFYRSDGDYGTSVQQTSDGGYIIAGATSGSYSSDVWLIKTDALGDMQWNQTLDVGDYDFGWSVQSTTDGGYIIAGETYNSMTDYYDVLLIKTDASGNMQWNKTFGGSEVDNYGCSVQQTSDEGYIITGVTISDDTGEDVYLIKTNSSGNKQWSKTFGGDDDDWGYSVQQTVDGGYIITGYTGSYGAGDMDVWLIKTNASGNIQWNKTFGGDDDDVGLAVKQTSDGGYIITGETFSYGAGDGDVWLIKTDENGNTILPTTKSFSSKTSPSKSHPQIRNRIGKFSNFSRMKRQVEKIRITPK